MENASKALLIAAAVLIAIVLISVGVKLLSGTRETSEKVEIVGSQLDSKNNEFYDDIRYNLERIDGFLPREKVKELFAFLNLSFDENKYNGDTLHITFVEYTGYMTVKDWNAGKLYDIYNTEKYNCRQLKDLTLKKLEKYTIKTKVMCIQKNPEGTKIRIWLYGD